MDESSSLVVKNSTVPLEIESEEEQETVVVDRSQHFTVRALVVGLFVGLLLCFSNMYFGLQTGWITMGSLQSSLLGFGIFKLLRFENFGPIENVLIQTTAVATGTMPLAAGFVSVIPAMALMKESDHAGGGINLEWWKLFLFAFGLAFFGVFVAVPLRKQTIIREKLPFPSGTATAKMIEVLHAQNINRESEENNLMKMKWKVLGITFFFSSLYAFIGYFVPVLKNIPIFTYCGWPEATAFYWTITPSLSYVGQGMIMGTRIGVSMLVGAFFGWGFLAPFSRYMGWAPGSISSYENGAIGWVMWVSLAIMIGEAFSSLGCVIFVSIARYIKGRIGKVKLLDEDKDKTPKEQLVPQKWWISGLLGSVVLCAVLSYVLFRQYINVWDPIVATLLALFVSILGVRALGETDVNPVSGVGKVTQLIFALVSPNNILSNLVAGAISEAGAQQAGDMMQDLKTGHLLRASPRAQFYAQMVGSAFSAVFAVGAYLLYTNAWEVPSSQFPIPTAYVWLQMARVVNGQELAPNVLWFCLCCGIIAIVLPILSMKFPHYAGWIPSGIAFAIAIYVTPNWTLPRVVGALVHYVWERRNPVNHKNYLIIVASGFVLGEGIFSIITAILKTAGVPIWTNAM